MRYKEYIKPTITSYAIDSTIILMGESATPSDGNEGTPGGRDDGGYDDIPSDARPIKIGNQQIFDSQLSSNNIF